MTHPVWNQPPGRFGLFDPAHEKDSCGVGFVAHVKGQRSHQIVLDADQVLRNMDHRGACGCDKNTVDGSGILTALPHEFFERVVRDELKSGLPEPGLYGVAQVFLPTDAAERAAIKKLGGKPEIRSLDRGYPFFTENGNIILDSDFGTIKNPKALSQKIKQITGVMESGIFIRKPDVIYRAKTGGKFDII